MLCHLTLFIKMNLRLIYAVQYLCEAKQPEQRKWGTQFIKSVFLPSALIPDYFYFILNVCIIASS